MYMYIRKAYPVTNGKPPLAVTEKIEWVKTTTVLPLHFRDALGTFGVTDNVEKLMNINEIYYQIPSDTSAHALNMYMKSYSI